MTLAEPAVPAKTSARRSTKPWERQPGEKDLWYARFLRYVALGPTRSISLVAKGRRNAYPVPAHWPVVSVQDNWRERATAFDEAARKDAHLITVWFLSALETARTRLTDPTEQAKMRGLQYRPPEEDDHGEPYVPVDTDPATLD